MVSQTLGSWPIKIKTLPKVNEKNENIVWFYGGTLNSPNISVGEK